MPRVNVAATTSTVNGTKLPNETDGDATNNHSVANSGNTRIIARNSGAGARVLTIHFNRTVRGSTITPITKSIPAGETWIFGPYPTDDFGTVLTFDVAHAELKLRTIE